MRPQTIPKMPKRTDIHTILIIGSGPIIIGENNLIEESARIINRNSDSGKSDAGTVPVMIIGNNNVFEVDCTSLALKIGHNNVLESKVS